MDRLPSSLFNHFRSWLTFSELHKNRRVSKRWTQLRDVEKVLTLGKSFLPFANFDKITSLSVEQMRGCSLELLKIHEIMTRNVNNLSTLRIHVWFTEQRDYTLVKNFVSSLPIFPKLTELILSDEHGLEDEMVPFYIKIIALCPKIKILELDNIYEFKIFDFSCFPDLEILRIEQDFNEYDHDIKNADQGSLKKLKISHYWTAPTGIQCPKIPMWIEFFPEIEITFSYGIEIGDHLRIKECVWSKSALTVKKIWIDVDLVAKMLKDTAEKLKEIICHLENIRSHPLQINVDFMNIMAETDMLAFKLVIARMKHL